MVAKSITYEERRGKQKSYATAIWTSFGPMRSLDLKRSNFREAWLRPGPHVDHMHRDAVAAYKAVEPLRVNPLKQLAIVRIDWDLSFHKTPLPLCCCLGFEIARATPHPSRDAGWSLFGRSRQSAMNGVLPRLVGLSHEEGLVSIAKSRIEQPSDGQRRRP